MKTLFSTILLLISINIVGQVKFYQTDNSILIENNQFQREIRVLSKEFNSMSNLFIEKRSKKQILSNSTNPWFEFSVDGKIITSNDRIWKLMKVDSRNMLNGGKEFIIHIINVNGLIVKITLQTYNNDSFFRERITLTSSESKSFRLTTVEGKLHFHFGAYSIPIEKKDIINTEEIRIATWNGQLLETDYSSSFDNKSLEEASKKGRNLEQNYMYHPQRISKIAIVNIEENAKGPFFIMMNKTKKNGFVIAYEHGSPDNDPEQQYISLNSKRSASNLSIDISLNNGAYYDGQLISSNSEFSSVWYSYNILKSSTITTAESVIWKYLYSYISENHHSRKPLFYYNTWGMQRDESMRGNDIRGILTESKIKKEIEDAAQLGIDLFVLDDGWQDYFGDWNTHKDRFPNGLKFYINELNKKGIMPGLWIAPLAVDPEAKITKEHPDWLIKDDKGVPVVEQWQKNFFCFNSDYKELFINICKYYIREGIKYFKWDGVNKHLCSSPFHHHGNESNTPEERKLLQGYSIPLEITDAIRQLKEYQPDVIIEVDVTEPHRSVGLAILSEARYFWMNNGASWYGDYSTYRAKSMRTITNLFAQFMPTTLQTFANFPIYDPVYEAQKYNVNTSFVGGHGFWGNIARMKPEERIRVGNAVEKIKSVEKYISGTIPKVTGNVGSSPEIYEYVDKSKPAGKIISFSGSALKSDYVLTGINSDNLLGVLDNSYSSKGDSLILHFEYYEPDDSKCAIILTNNGSGIKITSSTCWLDKISNIGNNLEYINGAPGIQIINWEKKNGNPEITSNKEINSSVAFDTSLNIYRIKVTTPISYSKISIHRSETLDR